MGIMAENELHSDDVLQGNIDANYTSASSRPIQPLPKRRLRSRLSEDANAAFFAVPPAPAAPLFYFPYNNYAGDATLGGTGSPGGVGSAHGVADGLQDSSDEDDNSSTSVSRGVGNSGAPGNFEGASSGGTTDPYEWTENTNNKKKRKIPTHTNPGGSTGGSGMGGGCGGTHSSPGFSPTSTPRSRWKYNGPSQRSPLTSVSSTNHASIRRSTRRYPSSPSIENSHRQANGGPKDDPITPTKTKHKVVGGDSGLPKQAQFTFVCDSPVSANLAYATSTPTSGGNPGGEGFSQPKSMQTVGTQTSPGISNSNYQQPLQPAKKKAPKPSRREVFQQQQRRRRQEALAHANNSGELWICEFCEYESIFGEPPEALMRQYEIKDRKERRRLAEKRRLLEKAKQKSRKNSGKHAGKKAGNHNTAPPPPPPPSTTDSQGTQSDNTPLASATQTPALKPTRQSQQVQTEAYLDGTSHHVSNGRGGSGAGGGGKAGVNDSGTPPMPA